VPKLKLTGFRHRHRYRRGNYKHHRTPWVSIVGNPNSGKTAIFNRLTGLHHKIGNYPGVTVERKIGRLKGDKILIEDLPGTYSLNSRSSDEKIVADFVQSWREAEHRPNAVIVVLDATNLSRNIYLALQILDWNIPTIIVLNMMDEANKLGIQIDVNLLGRKLNNDHIIPACAKDGLGIEAIIETVVHICTADHSQKSPPIHLTPVRKKEFLKEIMDYLELRTNRLYLSPEIDTIRLIAHENYFDYMKPYLNGEDQTELKMLIEKTRNRFNDAGISYLSLESQVRYQFIDMELAPAFLNPSRKERILSDKIDSILTHPVMGILIFALIMGFIFQSVFSWAQFPMGLIENGVTQFGTYIASVLPASAFKHLIIDGIIPGVGNVLIFFPQIILLVFFISILEDSGYMARMAFMTDHLMRKVGLNGKSVLPLLSGFACAIPAVMASRTIENWRDRVLIILLIPLMSCSARLPVYTLLISAFIPREVILGFVELQGIVLMAVYFLGFFSALFIAFVIKVITSKKKKLPFLMELPPYRLPMIRSLWWRVYDSGKTFLLNAGSIILAMTIILWFLASYPRTDPQSNLTALEKVEQSYAGKIGRLMEPVIKPLGFDWKIGVGLITSFAAREVIISTFATLYNIESEAEQNVVSLKTALREDHYADGRPVFSLMTALSLLVFFVYAAQCMSTFAIIKRETNSWRYPFIMLAYMNGLAYIASLSVYQIGSWLL
jgi:ferrous iron transport protein B